MSETPANKPSEEPSESAAPADEDRLALTIDLSTGRVDMIETMDAEGARHELGAKDRARLAERLCGRSLEAIVQQAFLAGMECLLGEEDDAEAPSRAEQELLRPLIQRSSAQRLIQPEVLRQAALEDLLRSAAIAEPARRSGVGGNS